MSAVFRLTSTDNRCALLTTPGRFGEGGKVGAAALVSKGFQLVMHTNEQRWNYIFQMWTDNGNATDPPLSVIPLAGRKFVSRSGVEQ